MSFCHISIIFYGVPLFFVLIVHGFLFLYYDVIFDKCEFPGTIQRFGNIHSEPGEYSLDAMLIASPTAPVHIMPLPIVSHQRNRYTVYVSSGIKRLKQSRVHFHSTPSCSADSGR